MLAPVLAGWIAVIGDPALYACAGDARVGDVVLDDPGHVTVTVLGAGERVRLVGWSAHPIAAHAWAPATAKTPVAATRDAATGAWELAVDSPVEMQTGFWGIYLFVP